uniref:Uncharacterized protein n=1 Tax=viral metagenome TaxID=1070528 RepID=A0A6C0D6M3_9ZZZZ
MPSLNNSTDSFHSAHPRRQYITTSAFNNDIYSYAVTLNPRTYVKTGALTALTTATALNCPANRILRENGRRLVKDANPGISTLMVGVYDAVSGLSGLIDPNSPRFAMYNGDKSVFQDNGVDPSSGLTDQGPPIYTRGTVTAGNGVTATAGGVTATAGGVTITAGGLTVNGGAIVETVSSSAYSGNSVTLDLTTGNIFNVTAVTAGLTIAATGGSKGMVYYVNITANGAYAITAPASTVLSTLLTINGSVLVTAVRTA